MVCIREKKSQHSITNIDLGSMTTQQTFQGSSVESCGEQFLAGRHAPFLTQQILLLCVACVAADCHYQEGGVWVCVCIYICIPQLMD